MFKSIYKKLLEDFSFCNNYGFYYLQDLKHYVEPSILFKRDHYGIQIGFSYEKGRFFANCYDSIKKRQLSEEAFVTLKWLASGKEHSFSDGINECTDILDGVSLSGDSYRDQIDHVKDLLRDYLVACQK